MAASRDIHHDAQLLRDLVIVNTRTQAELGPLPPGGLPVELKRKPKPWPSPSSDGQHQENEAMKLSTAAAVTAIGVASMLGACGADDALQESSPAATAREEQSQPASTEVTTAKQEHLSQAVGTDPSISEAMSMSDVPSSVRAFIKPDDVLLAYKAMDLTGNGKSDHVIVLRHASSAPEKKGNVCDLLVLHEDGHDLSLAAKSSRVVDCELNEMNIGAGEFELNQNLELSAQRVEFTNENPRGGYYGYVFGYVDGKWNLLQATSAYKEDDPGTPDIEMYEETASYPQDFGLISLSDFEPDVIEAALRKNKSLVK